jgi:hypothetical protein
MVPPKPNLRGHRTSVFDWRLKGLSVPCGRPRALWATPVSKDDHVPKSASLRVHGRPKAAKGMVGNRRRRSFAAK